MWVWCLWWSSSYSVTNGQEAHTARVRWTEGRLTSWEGQSGTAQSVIMLLKTEHSTKLKRLFLSEIFYLMFSDLGWPLVTTETAGSQTTDKGGEFSICTFESYCQIVLHGMESVCPASPACFLTACQHSGCQTLGVFTSMRGLICISLIVRCGLFFSRA